MAATVSDTNMRGDGTTCGAANAADQTLVPPQSATVPTTQAPPQEAPQEAPAAFTAARGGNASAYRPNPAIGASWWSFVTYGYMSNLVRGAYQHGATLDDVWHNPEVSTAAARPQFQRAWALERKERGSGARLLAVLRRLFLPAFLRGLVAFFGHILFAYAMPQVLRQVILYLEGDEDLPAYHPYVAGVLILVFSWMDGFLLQHAFRLCFICAARIRAALMSAIYDKALRLSSSSSGRAGSTVGDITNLVSADCRRLLDGSQLWNITIASPVIIVVGMALLFNLLGWPSLVGFACYIVLFPINSVFARRQMKYRRVQLHVMDDRVKVTNEVLQGIKSIKMFGWEDSFLAQVGKLRSAELEPLKQFAIAQNMNIFAFTFTPVIAAAVTFIVYAALGNELTASTVFPAVAYLSLIRLPMQLMPIGGSIIIDMRVAAVRIGKFLMLPEKQPIQLLEVNGKDGVVVSQGSFTWGPPTSPQPAIASETEQPPAFLLKNINLRVAHGSMVAVVGMVGSGKTSLCSAVLSEMHKVSGNVRVHGRVAYVAQEAFILNDTIKANIIFGRPWNKELYRAAIDACALQSDFDILEKGDVTVVGDRGITLSGGQKARVSLARAVYSQADVFVMDDPTAAVDAWVGQHLFEQCVVGIMGNKTRVYVTNHIDQAKAADLVVLMEDGEIADQGTYEQLSTRSSKFRELLEAYHTAEERARHAGDDAKTDDATDDATACMVDDEQHMDVTSRSKSNAIVRRRQESHASASGGGAEDVEMGHNDAEEQRVGGVSLGLAWRYCKNGFRPRSIIALFLASLLCQLFLVAHEAWLALWSANTFPSLSTNSNLIVYAMLAVGNSILHLAITAAVIFMVLQANLALHDSLLRGVLRSAQRFFDTTPAGRILNRFSKDLSTIDTGIQESLGYCLTMFVQVALQFVSIAVVLPPVVPVLAVAAYLLYKVQLYYRPSSRDMQRVETIAHSPLYSHLSETLQGVASIRAYGNAQVRRFARINTVYIDKSTDAWFMFQLCNEWLSIRLHVICVITLTVMCVVSMALRDYLNAGLTSLAFFYCFSLLNNLQWAIQVGVQLEGQLTSVERVFDYADLPSEPYKSTSLKPPQEWPARGQLEFKDVCMRYRDDLPLVLNNLTFDVAPGHKVAIVGRTGAGKSSLVMSLFRLVDVCGGTITLDGINIADVGLDDLRQSRVAIIPQEPVLFSGTIRYNLDPFNLYDDDDVATALLLAHLRPPEFTIHTEVAENGGNLSVGERQLLCLARAILRKPRLLVLDEATASVDSRTDVLVQATVREQFPEATVLTIAHRLNTIMDYDMVVVMHEGQVTEMGSPAELVNVDTHASQHRNAQGQVLTGPGTFASMVEAGGPEVCQRLRELAARAARGLELDIAEVDVAMASQ